MTRLAIGPANYAGQAYAWSRAVRRYLGIEAFSFGGRSAFKFPVDIEDGNSYEKIVAEGDYSHILIDGFVPFLGIGNFKTDIYALRRMGKPIGLVAHGSEFRDPKRHMKRIQHSHFHNAQPSYTRALVKYNQMTRKIVKHTQLPLFVSTPDLLLEGFEGTWLPVTVTGWECNRALSTKKPKVLHHPSRTDPPIKGTKFIMPVLENLADQGRIELVNSEMGLHSGMKPLVQSCDILVEQILIGSYGVAAVEGMMAGKLVIGYVAPDVREIANPPIVDARPDKFEEVMCSVLDNWDYYRKYADKGRDYADTFHNGWAAADALRDWVTDAVQERETTAFSVAEEA